MDYKKIKRKNYTLHLINTDRFKRVETTIRFTKKYEKEEGAYLKLLGRVLTFNGTNKYKTVNDLSKRLEYLYDCNLNYNFYAISKNMVFEASLTCLNKKYTNEEDYYEKVYEVLKETLVHPFIKNNRFNEEVFNLEKENLIRSISNVKDLPEDYAQVKFEENFYKDTVFGENNFKNLEIFKNLDNEKLYKTYKKLFNEYRIDVFVVGEEEESVVPYLDNLLDNFEETDNYYNDLYIDLKPKTMELKEEFQTNQSTLLIGLTLDNLTDEEKDYYLVLYNTILGCMNNSVLFVNVREKNSLCYTIGSTINRFTSTIVINSGINKKNYEKTIKIIKESLESMKEEKTILPLLNNAKKTLEISYNDFYDNTKKIINHYYTNEFAYIPSIEERRKKILESAANTITEIAKKVEIKNIFLLEGSINEED